MKNTKMIVGVALLAACSFEAASFEGYENRATTQQFNNETAQIGSLVFKDSVAVITLDRLDKATIENALRNYKEQIMQHGNVTNILIKGPRGDDEVTPAKPEWYRGNDIAWGWSWKLHHDGELLPSVSLARGEYFDQIPTLVTIYIDITDRNRMLAIDKDRFVSWSPKKGYYAPWLRALILPNK